MEPTGIRVAMWSGPRNISTALMRSWGSRADTVVCDEPFYAHFLRVTGSPHPGRTEIIAHHESDWRAVAAALLAPLPAGKAIFYQKQMAHHLLPGMDQAWLLGLRNAFLIRDPGQMLPSLLRVLPGAGLSDTGLPQQVALFERLADAQGRAPPVVDARDVLLDPPTTLHRLCAALGVAFDPAMLHWQPGPRPTDGIWAKHWYGTVEQSTGFEPYRASRAPLPRAALPLYEQCRPLYERLAAHRLCAL